MYHIRAQPVPLRGLEVPAVHGQHQVRHRRHPLLRRQQQPPLRERRLPVKQIAVDRVDHQRTPFHPQQRQPGKKSRQGGVDADKLVPLLPNQLPQERRRPEVPGRPHRFRKWDLQDPLRIRRRSRGVSAGRMDPPAQALKVPQVREVEVLDVGPGGSGKQHLSFHIVRLLCAAVSSVPRCS